MWKMKGKKNDFPLIRDMNRGQYFRFRCTEGTSQVVSHRYGNGQLMIIDDDGTYYSMSAIDASRGIPVKPVSVEDGVILFEDV